MPHRHAPRRSSYTARRALCEGVAAGRVAAALAGALALAGCAGGGPLATILPADPLATGSIARPAPLTLGLSADDWGRAEEALAEALDPLGSAAEIAWANPKSRIAGVIGPAGGPRLEGDLVCRAFAARTTRADGATERHEGRACRLAAGRWRIEEARAVDETG